MTTEIRLLSSTLALLLAGLACSAEPSSKGVRAVPNNEAAQEPAEDTEASTNGRTGSGPFEIVLGEWAVTPEADAIRPGPVTIRITNRGSMTHGFEIEADDDHSGSGSGDGFKFETRLIQPGESVKVRLDLAPGTYKIECLVDGHDDMGMEGFLEVRRGAGAGGRTPQTPSDEVGIRAFSFEPAAIEVTTGTEVTWTNKDPTKHTVTGDGFGSDTLAAGDRFSHRFRRAGTYRYRCAIHPEMTARVTVTE
jgi:plastocyanin